MMYQQQHSGGEEPSALQDAIAEVQDREEGELVRVKKVIRQSVKDAINAGQNDQQNGNDSGDSNSESEDDDYAPPSASDSEPEPENSGNDTDDSGTLYTVYIHFSTI
jgi:hypothetical protein